jgi:hypothetical protein
MPIVDRSAGSADHHHEQHFNSSETVRDIVIGLADGLTVPFALAAGIAGAVTNVANPSRGDCGWVDRDGPGRLPGLARRHRAL